MNKVIDIDTDKTTLIELVTGLKPDDEVVIVKDHKPVAKLVATSSVRQPRVPGLLKGKLTILAEDDEHLAGFEESMP
jgi:antitoxin (DNA-binding transcriptional repressor) of toxin-antitoxin stability system